jgi:flagellar biogenesis protein FliO
VSGTATAVQVVASLVVVLLLVVVVGRFARRAGVRGEGAGLRVVERVGLTRETAVAVVEVAGRTLVVGTSAHGVTLLAELEPGQARAARATDPAGVKVTRVVTPPATSTAPRTARPGTAQPRPAQPQAAQPRPAQPAARPASPARAVPAQRGSGAVLDPRTWRQGLDALRDLTVRRG